MYPSRHSSYPDVGTRSAPELRCAALIDARYLRWLARFEEGEGASAPALSRTGINEMVHQALSRADLRCRVLRSYWYCDADDQATVDDQALRLLPSADGDGAALVRHMAADLQSLVASGRVDVVLIASDDDRLSVAIESAKQAGLTVCLLADERAQAMPRLQQQDPNWARLLREADRRVIVRSADLAQALVDGSASSAGPGYRTAPPRDEELEAVVNGWWQQVPADEQEALRDELPDLRGLPPEVDRELLLRCKNALSRGLNFPEKRMLREYARRVALGQGAVLTDAGDEAGAGSAET